MTWTYHPLKDEIVVTYGVEARPAARTVSGGAGTVIDVDPSGALIRICIRTASRLCPAEVLRTIHALPGPGEQLWTIPEAASMLGVQPYVLRREVLEGGMPAKKTDDSWRVRDCIMDLCRELLQARRHLVVEQHND